MIRTSLHWCWLLIFLLLLVGWVWHYNCQFDREQVTDRIVPTQVSQETSKQLVQRYQREAYWQVVNNPVVPLEPTQKEVYQDQYLRDHGWVLRFSTGKPASCLGGLYFPADVSWYNPAGHLDRDGADRMKRRAIREMETDK